MITKENAHLYISYLQALIEGKTLQVRDFYSSQDWVDARETGLSFFNPPDYYRVKPEKRWCRVALCKSSNPIPYTCTVETVSEESNAANSRDFIKWLTDRIEYE